MFTPLMSDPVQWQPFNFGDNVKCQGKDYEIILFILSVSNSLKMQIEKEINDFPIKWVGLFFIFYLR